MTTRTQADRALDASLTACEVYARLDYPDALQEAQSGLSGTLHQYPSGGRSAAGKRMASRLLDAAVAMPSGDGAEAICGVAITVLREHAGGAMAVIRAGGEALKRPEFAQSPTAHVLRAAVDKAKASSNCYRLVVQSRKSQSAGDLTKAARLLEEALQTEEAKADPHVQAQIAELQMDVAMHDVSRFDQVSAILSERVARGDLAEVERLLRKLRKAHPESPDAERLAEEVRALERQHIDGLVVRLNTSVSEGQLDGAEELARQLRELGKTISYEPADAVTALEEFAQTQAYQLFGLAEAAIQKGKVGDALGHLDAVDAIPQLTEVSRSRLDELRQSIKGRRESLETACREEIRQLIADENYPGAQTKLAQAIKQGAGEALVEEQNILAGFWDTRKKILDATELLVNKDYSAAIEAFGKLLDGEILASQRVEVQGLLEKAVKRRHNDNCEKIPVIIDEIMVLLDLDKMSLEDDEHDKVASRLRQLGALELPDNIRQEAQSLSEKGRALIEKTEKHTTGALPVCLALWLSPVAIYTLVSWFLDGFWWALLKMILSGIGLGFLILLAWGGIGTVAGAFLKEALQKLIKASPIVQMSSNCTDA